jgi:hypothetical protein
MEVRGRNEQVERRRLDIDDADELHKIAPMPIIEVIGGVCDIPITLFCKWDMPPPRSRR